MAFGALIPNRDITVLCWFRDHGRRWKASIIRWFWLERAAVNEKTVLTAVLKKIRFVKEKYLTGDGILDTITQVIVK